MKQLRSKIADLSRREQEHRKNLHGKLSHKVLSMGNDIRTEKLSYKSFQRNFGKSVGFRAPGGFVAKLKATVKKWIANVQEFETRTTMLSQTCPKCGTLRKKKLSERWHSCSCGAEGQRDLVSAYLATHVVGNKLDVVSASKGWRGACKLLRAVSSSVKGATGKRLGECPPGKSRIERASHEKEVCKSVSASDVVAGRKTRARAEEKPVERFQLALFQKLSESDLQGSRRRFRAERVGNMYLIKPSDLEKVKHRPNGRPKKK
jgi:putative transposase